MTPEEKRKKKYEWNKLWRKNNPDKVKESNRKSSKTYRERHPDRVAKTFHQYQLTHREELNKYQRERQREITNAGEDDPRLQKRRKWGRDYYWKKKLAVIS